MKRYHVEINFSTFADSPEEALSLAIQAIQGRTGGEAEVIEDDTDVCVLATTLAGSDG